MSIDIAGVKVRALKMGEIRRWYTEFMAGETGGDWIQETAHPDISTVDLALMTDRTALELEALTCSEFSQLVAEAKALNPSYFVLRDRIREVAAELDRNLADALASSPE
jgi:hypothetical protein